MKCLLMKRLISSALDDGRPFRDSVERHVAGCADCRAYHERLAALHQTLSAKADEQAAPSRMHARIMISYSLVELLELSVPHACAHHGGGSK